MFGHEDGCPVGGSRRATLAGIEDRGQALGLDRQEVSTQDSGRSTHALDHGTAPIQTSLSQVDRQQLKLSLFVPRPLLGRISDEDLVLLLASSDAGVGMVEASDVQVEEDRGSNACVKHVHVDYARSWLSDYCSKSGGSQSNSIGFPAIYCVL